MKKVISLILTLVLLVSVLSVPVFAAETEEETYLYKDEFIDQYVGEYEYEEGYYFYEEVYYHHTDENDPESDIDWVLVNAGNNMCLPWLVKGEIGDIVFYDYNEYCPFAFNWAVYDVGNNYFSELSEAAFRTYEDLEQVCKEIGVGQPVGDADFDGELTVLDVTYIQRVIAKLDEFNEKDDITEFYALYGDLDYVSDMNRDGERNIMDATAIQRKLASLGYLSRDLLVRDYTYEEFSAVKNTMNGECSLQITPMYNGYALYETDEVKTDSDYFVALINSKKQYYDIFGAYEDEYDDEFFAQNSLVASAMYITDADIVCKVAEVGVEGSKMYVAVDRHSTKISSDVPTASPIATLYYSFVAVDKDDVSKVKSIELKKPWYKSLVWDDKSHYEDYAFTGEIEFTSENLPKNEYMRYDSYRQDFVAIIDDYKEFTDIFKYYAYDASFFETKALIVNISACDNMWIDHEITQMEVKDGTLYIKEKIIAIDGYYTKMSVPAIIHDFCVVDKADVEGVTDIRLVR